jgi:hypothetical protein
MKVTLNKCEYCGRLFEEEEEFALHIHQHIALQELNRKFPKVDDTGCKFVNGDFSVQRSEKWLDSYKKEIVALVSMFKQIPSEYKPTTYGWFRALGDSNSMFYDPACRVLNVCPKCFKEWGQLYFAKNCKC